MARKKAVSAKQINEAEQAYGRHMVEPRRIYRETMVKAVEALRSADVEATAIYDRIVNE